MILPMATADRQDKMYVRPTPEARHALKTVLVALQNPTLFGPDLTQEDFVSASWLWMAEIGSAGVAVGIRKHVEAVRAARKRAKEGAIKPDVATTVIAAPGMTPKRPSKRSG